MKWMTIDTRLTDLFLRAPLRHLHVLSMLRCVAVYHRVYSTVEQNSHTDVNQTIVPCCEQSQTVEVGTGLPTGMQPRSQASRSGNEAPGIYRFDCS